MSAQKKVSIKPLQELRFKQDLRDLTNRTKRESKEEVVRLVESEGFNNALVLTEDGRGIQCVAFPHNEKLMLGPAPHPVDLYFGIAYSFMLIADKALQKLDQIPTVPGENLVMCWDNTFNAFLQYRISFVMLLHATVETFINNIVPGGEYRYERKRKAKSNEKSEDLAKEEIERLDFSEKLRRVVPDATGVDVAQTNSILFKRILALNDLRRDVTHLTSIANGKSENYFTVYVKLSKMDMRDAFDAVRDYVNLIRPDTIQFKEE